LYYLGSCYIRLEKSQGLNKYGINARQIHNIAEMK
jgi:hypothetical protein